MSTERSVRDIVDEIQQLCKELAAKTVVPTTVYDPPSNAKKLTSSDAKRIRELKRSTGMSNQELADVFDCNRSTITRILNGMYWK